MKDLLLGIDVGTTAAKACLFSRDGRVISTGSCEYPTHHLRPNWVEQDPEDWWNAICIALRAALDQISNGAERVAGVSISAQAPTLLPVDRLGKPLCRALIWMDRRADQQVHWLSETFGADTIFDRTGNRADGFFIAAKLRWMRDHRPDILRGAFRFLQVNGYAVFRMTGQFSLDNAHASLLGMRDPVSGDWWTELCEACGVVVDQFPPVQSGETIIGEVTAAAAAECGLRPGTPVMTGTVDGSAAALEAGAVENGIAAEMTGTSTVVLMASDRLITHPSLISIPHAAPGKHLLLGAMSTTGAALGWFRDQFGHVEQAAAPLLEADAFELLTRQAAAAPTGSTGVIFLPYLAGERSPIWHTQARGVFFGISLSTRRSAMIRAILEGAAYMLRHNIEVAQSAGMTINEIRSLGGGARSALWNQIKADVLGIPVVLPEASIGAPFGDALLVGLGLGWYHDLAAEVQSMVRVRARFEPDPQRYDLYTPMYGLFRDVYQHLQDDFNHAAEIVAQTDSVE